MHANFKIVRLMSSVVVCPPSPRPSPLLRMQTWPSAAAGVTPSYSQRVGAQSGVGMW